MNKYLVEETIPEHFCLNNGSVIKVNELKFRTTLTSISPETAVETVIQDEECIYPFTIFSVTDEKGKVIKYKLALQEL